MGIDYVVAPLEADAQLAYCCRPEGGSTLCLGSLCFTHVQSTERTMYSRHESRYMKIFGCLFAIRGVQGGTKLHQAYVTRMRGGD